MAVVDDDPAIARTLARILVRGGHDVEAFTSAEALLARCGERRFDVVVTDLRMPRIDGLGLARRLRASDAGRFALVLVTGSEIELGAPDRAHFHAIVPKPFTSETLLAAVQTAMNAASRGSE